MAEHQSSSSSLYSMMTPANSRLIVIDVINSCAHQRCEIPEWNITFRKIREMAARLLDFIDKFRNRGGQLVFVRTTPWRREFLPDNLNELYTDPAAVYYSTDTSGFPEEFYLVSPEPEDLIITKNQYDAFGDIKFARLLRQKGVRYLIIAGIFADGCVHATINGAFTNGFNLIILKDLIETTDVPVRQEIRRLMIDYTWPVMYGKTIDSSDFLRQMK